MVQVILDWQKPVTFLAFLVPLGTLFQGGQSKCENENIPLLIIT